MLRWSDEGSTMIRNGLIRMEDTTKSICVRGQKTNEVDEVLVQLINPSVDTSGNIQIGYSETSLLFKLVNYTLIFCHWEISNGKPI